MYEKIETSIKELIEPYFVVDGMVLDDLESCHRVENLGLAEPAPNVYSRRNYFPHTESSLY